MKNFTNNFPKNFLWGAATSAYQIEGAFDSDGRTSSIWDTFCQQPGKIYEGQSGEIACQHYTHWQDDIKIMQDIGVNAYRFSISWSRIFPDSSLKVNQKGIDFYSRLIDKLLETGIQPFVTMYHWDLPQYIQDQGGWSSRETCKLFRDYAYTLTKYFSDRVHYWTTLNEPSVAVYAGHFFGTHAPGLQSPEIALQSLHHFLLAHGLAVQAIRSSFKVELGIALNLSPVFPADPNSPLDCQAAKLYDTYLYRAFLDALFFKKYPHEMFMDKIVFPNDMEVIATPMDYVGINYYTVTRVAFDKNVPVIQARVVPPKPNFYSDLWEFFPTGLSTVINRIWNEYHHSKIYILENGTSLNEGENDQGRIEYLKAHLQEVSQCLKKGIDIKGYFVWSLLDNFEWASGYSKRFGLVSVDFETLERKPNASAHWYASLIHG